MNVNLNLDEINYLIEILNERKDDMLCILLDDEIEIDFDIDSFSKELSGLYDLKSKLCNYSNLLLEEN